MYIWIKKGHYKLSTYASISMSSLFEVALFIGNEFTAGHINNVLLLIFVSRGLLGLVNRDDESFGFLVLLASDLEHIRANGKGKVKLEKHVERHGNGDDPGAADVSSLACLHIQIFFSLLDDLLADVGVHAEEQEGTCDGEHSMQSQIGPVEG